jgi:hypothetical protein
VNSKTHNSRVATWLGPALIFTMLLAVIGCSAPTAATPVPAALTSEPASTPDSVVPTLETPTSTPIVIEQTSVGTTVTSSPITTATATTVPTPVPPTPTLTPPTPTTTATAIPTATATATSIPPTSTPTATSTPVPTPTSTPAPVPTVAAGTLPVGITPAFVAANTLELPSTPVPTPFAIPEGPFPEATQRPATNSNLQPYFGSAQPLRVRNPNGGPFVEKSDLVLDWFITNEGPENAVGNYSVDIYLDEILADRWKSSNLRPNFFLSVEGHSELLDLFNLTPGTHTVKLVADPLNQLAETTESDNSYSDQFVWEGLPVPTPLADERLPNFSTTVRTGDKPPMVVAPFADSSSSGGLSVNGDTYISISILNDSPITVQQSIGIHILFDGLVVYRFTFEGLLGGNSVDFEWNDLASTIPITAGTHTLAVIVDPTGAIAETNENDNSYEINLVWGVDPPLASPEPTSPIPAPARPVQIFANLIGHTPYGWDAAISASRTSDELALGTDGDLASNEPTTISYSVQNNGRFNTSGAIAYQVELWVGNQLLDTSGFSTGSDAGSIWVGSVEIPAGKITPGAHLVKIVIDREERIAEHDESDNTVGRWMTWLAEPKVVADPEPFVFSNEQLDELLAPIFEREFLDQVRPAELSDLNSTDWVPTIEAAGRAGYYLLTGRDLESERMDVHFLAHDEYVTAEFDSCMRNYEQFSDILFEASFTSCQVNESIGFKQRYDGKIHVHVDLGHSPIQVLSTYFHEIGHALQDLTNPEFTEGVRDPNTRALAEAQAQIFQAAALRAIEDHSGTALMRYPDIERMQDFVDFHLENKTGSSDHLLGYRMLWMESLANTSGLGTAEELATEGRLSSGTAKGLFDYLVGLPLIEIDSWVSTIFSVPSREQEFMAISRTRLESDLPVAEYSNPDLYRPAFLVP